VTDPGERWPMRACGGWGDERRCVGGVGRTVEGEGTIDRGRGGGT
jgi:hypothetical protein